MADITIIACGTELNDDWIRAAGLKKLGTPEALVELERMENQVMVGYTPEELERIAGGESE